MDSTIEVIQKYSDHYDFGLYHLSLGREGMEEDGQAGLYGDLLCKSKTSGTINYNRCDESIREMYVISLF